MHVISKELSSMDSLSLRSVAAIPVKKPVTTTMDFIILNLTSLKGLIFLLSQGSMGSSLWSLEDSHIIAFGRKEEMNDHLSYALIYPFRICIKLFFFMSSYAFRCTCIDIKEMTISYLSITFEMIFSFYCRLIQVVRFVYYD